MIQKDVSFLWNVLCESHVAANSSGAQLHQREQAQQPQGQARHVWLPGNKTVLNRCVLCL